MAGTDSFAVAQLLQDTANQDQAGILKSALTQGFVCRAISLDLTNGYGAPYGNPFPVKFPFKAVFVRSATDSTTSVTLALNSDAQINLENGIQLFNNDMFKLGSPVAGGAIVAAAQPGKSVTLYFIVQGDFQSGSQVSQVSGGVAVVTGTGMTPQNAVTVTSAATQLVAIDTSRKKATFQNRGGGSIFVSGTNAVKNAAGGAGTAIGIEVGPGQIFEWTATGAAWAISDGSNYVVSINTEA